MASMRRGDPIVLLRVAIAALFLIHGATRASQGGVAPFGEFLSGVGFPAGYWWAFAVTALELGTTPLLALGIAVRPIAAYLSFQTALGIALVHWPNGWFVVGAGRNGMEYSVLLIVCLACIAWNAPGARRRTFR
jgi:putative oxidoreductase